MAGAKKGKREQIVEAASRLFLERGYAATSMDAVTQAAGVSKATVYAHFPSKEHLFGAMVRCRCEESLPVEMPAKLRQGSPREVLGWIGHRFLELVMSPEALGMFRTLVAEGPRNPDLSAAFWAAGPHPTYALISGYLVECRDKGLLKVKDPQLAAEEFISMLRGNYYHRVLLGLAEPDDKKETDRAVAGAVETLLAALKA